MEVGEGGDLGRRGKWRVHQSGVEVGHQVRIECAFLILTTAAAAQPVVAVDGFHNNEGKMPDHYRWEGTRPGGYSELGQLLRGLGADLRTVQERVTPAALAGIDLLIIA